MEQFLTRVMIAVMTAPAVEEMLQRLVKSAVDESMSGIIDKYDSLDGKMGNVQEQVAQMPGQVIGGVIQGVEDAIGRFNPLGGMFGQR